MLADENHGVDGFTGSESTSSTTYSGRIPSEQLTVGACGKGKSLPMAHSKLIEA